MILPARPFYPAEEHHQDYYRKNVLHYSAYKVGSGRAGFIERTWKKEKKVSDWVKPDDATLDHARGRMRHVLIDHRRTGSNEAVAGADFLFGRYDLHRRRISSSHQLPGSQVNGLVAQCSVGVRVDERIARSVDLPEFGFAVGDAVDIDIGRERGGGRESDALLPLHAAAEGVVHIILRRGILHGGRVKERRELVRVEGDYNAGPGPYTSHGDNASLSMLTSNTKYFGGARDAWKWENGKNSSGSAGNLDPGGESNKRVALYDFKAGKTYKLVVSGRSRYFRIDRLMFRKSTVSESYAENMSRPESSTTTGGGETYTYDATTDFPNITAGETDYYKHTAENALAIDATIVADRGKFARAHERIPS